MTDLAGSVARDRCAVGECIGAPVEPYAACLAHLPRHQLLNRLATLGPGADVDARGVAFGPASPLDLLLDALRGDDGRVVFGTAAFDGAAFEADLRLDDAVFRGPASFRGVRFGGGASFGRAEFEHGAVFGGGFAGPAGMAGARFGATATFDGAVFGGGLDLAGAEFTAAVSLRACTFDAHVHLGPIGPVPALSIEDCTFSGGAVIEAAAAEVSLRRSRFDGPAHVRLREATVCLDGAVFGRGGTVSGPGRSAAARVASLRGVDCTDLAFADVDLTRCRFEGAYQLDKLRIEGGCRLLHTRGLRWSRREVIADECDLRSAAVRPWPAGAALPPPSAMPPSADRVAFLYRQLRKGREDAKNEPGAADFYYGEMEMRRIAPTTAWGERVVLHIYRLVSGYGLRATRALAALAALLVVTVALLMAVGLPTGAATTGETAGVVSPAATGIGYTVAVTDRPPPLRAEGPLRDRLSAARMERAARVALGAVVFRDSSQQLTVAGRYVELCARLLGPILLALAVLAVRNRVKR